MLVCGLPDVGCVAFSDAERRRRRRWRQKKSRPAAPMAATPTPTPVPAAAPVERLEEEVSPEAGTGVLVATAPVVVGDFVLLDVLELVLLVEVSLLEALHVVATPVVETIMKLALLKALDFVAGSTKST